MKGRWLAGAAAVVVAGGLGVWQLCKPSPAPARRPFSGERGVARNVVYTQDDPGTRNNLIVRAAVAVTRDGKVGTLFQSPLRPEVDLTKAEVELLSREGTLFFRAASDKGRYDPKTGGVSLEGPREARAGELSVQATTVGASRQTARWTCRTSMKSFELGSRSGRAAATEGLLPCSGEDTSSPPPRTGLKGWAYELIAPWATYHR